MKLVTAYICVECEEIFEPQGTDAACPSCTNKETKPLSVWLRTAEGAEK